MISAPRHPLFAILMCISFFVHTVLFIFSTVQQTTKNRTYKGEQILEQIVNESNVSLVYQDKVSLSVIANRHIKEYDVERIVIRSPENQVLVAVGNQTTQAEQTIDKVVTNKNRIVGGVQLTMKSSNKIELIKSLWLFVLFSLASHLILWLLCQHFVLFKHTSLAQHRRLRTFDKPKQRRTIDNDSVLSKQASAGIAIEKNTVAVSANDTDAIKKSTQKEPTQKQKEPIKIPKKVFGELAEYIKQQKAQQAEIAVDPSTIVPTAIHTSISAHGTKKSLNKPHDVSTKDSKQNNSNHNEHNQQISTEHAVEQHTDKPTISPLSPLNVQQPVAIKPSLTFSVQKDVQNLADDQPVAKGVNKDNISLSQATDKLVKTPNEDVLAANVEQTIVAKVDRSKPDTQNMAYRLKKMSMKLASIKAKNSDLIPKAVQPATPVSIKFKYIDRYHLLDKLAPSFAQSYFRLYENLLTQAIDELLADPELQGVCLHNTPTFNDEGAVVHLYAKNGSQHKLWLASVMLTTLYDLMIEFIYDTHRETGKFALKVASGISLVSQEDKMNYLMQQNVDESIDTLVLCDKMARQDLAEKTYLRKAMHGEYVYVDGVKKELLEPLVRICYHVLEINK